MAKILSQKTRRNLISGLAVSFFLILCGCGDFSHRQGDHQPPASSLNELFNQSSRRVLKPEQSWGLGALYVQGNGNEIPDCVVTFLDDAGNSAQIATVMAQRSCFEGAPETWCDQGNGVRGLIRDWESHHLGHCQAIRSSYVGFDAYDAFIFTASIERNTAHVMQLADYIPALRTRVVIPGFPNDALYRQTENGGDLVLNRNCWVTKSSPDFLTGRHNCSVSGTGNLGSPVIIDSFPFGEKGALPVVIGMISPKSIQVLTPLDPYASGADNDFGYSQVYLSAGLKDGSKLRLATEQSNFGTQNSAMRAGRYHSEESRGEDFEILPYYYNKTDPVELLVKTISLSRDSRESRDSLFYCAKNPPYIMTCKYIESPSKGLSFHFDKADQFLLEYSNQPGVQYRFRYMP